GFGVSLMEAAAMGVPIIATDIIGCNEVVKDGYNGVLVPPKSIEGLIIMMEKLLVDKQKLKDMSSVTRKYVIEKYEQKELWKKTLTAYRSITLEQ
ncbi:MAG: glycosyltransferase family 1 protein, partial [Epsilonproteobacteria bacterium]